MYRLELALSVLITWGVEMNNENVKVSIIVFTGLRYRTIFTKTSKKFTWLDIGGDRNVLQGISGT